MIVIALAALAYTWFSGIFASLTSTAGTAVTTTTGAMATQFVIDAAKQTTATSITFVIRNTGTQSIDLGTLNAYLSDGTALSESASTILTSGQRSAPIPATGATTCTACTAGICYVSGKIQTIRITIGTGLENAATVNC